MKISYVSGKIGHSSFGAFFSSMLEGKPVTEKKRMSLAKCELPLKDRTSIGFGTQTFNSP
jgi:hypothetical protein